MISFVVTPRRAAPGVLMVPFVVTAVDIAVPGAPNDAHLLCVCACSPRRCVLPLTDRGIRPCGPRRALDDFGTGFSSLPYLLQANLHTINIDRSFVSEMSTDPTRQTIVETVIGLTRALGLQVIAHGVDVGPQIDLLTGMGCPFGQGILVSEPLVASGMVDFLDAADSRRRSDIVVEAGSPMCAGRLLRPLRVVHRRHPR